MEEAVHWHDETVLGSKAYFYHDTQPPALKIRKVQKVDEGQYRYEFINNRLLLTLQEHGN